MRRWWRSHSVRVQLTLWYVAAMILVLGVYAAAVLAYVSRSASHALDEQLRGDFQWAAGDGRADAGGGIRGRASEGGDEERPWLQVWSRRRQLLFRNDRGAAAARSRAAICAICPTTPW